MLPENELAEMIRIDAAYCDFSSGPKDIFLGQLSVYFDTYESARDFQKEIRGLEKERQFFDAEGPYQDYSDSKSSYLVLKVYPFPPYCFNKGVEILKFLNDNYSLPQTINVSGYDPEKLGTGTIIPSFGQISLTEINELELPLKEFISYFQIRSLDAINKIKESINKISLLTDDTIKIAKPLICSNGKIILQITCSNALSAKALRMALLSLANDADTYDRIHLRRATGVAGEYYNDMFVLTAKSSSDLEKTLQAVGQSTASCSDDIAVGAEPLVASCSLDP